MGSMITEPPPKRARSEEGGASSGAGTNEELDPLVSHAEEQSAEPDDTPASRARRVRHHRDQRDRIVEVHRLEVERRRLATVALCQCPSTQDWMRQPVLITACGHTFDRASLVQWEGRTCPQCRVSYEVGALVPNWAVRNLVGLYRPGSLLPPNHPVAPAAAVPRLLGEQDAAFGEDSSEDEEEDDPFAYALDYDDYNDRGDLSDAQLMTAVSGVSETAFARERLGDGLRLAMGTIVQRRTDEIVLCAVENNFHALRSHSYFTTPIPENIVLAAMDHAESLFGCILGTGPLEHCRRRDITNAVAVSYVQKGGRLVFLVAVWPEAGDSDDIVKAAFARSGPFEPFFEHTFPYVSQRVKTVLLPTLVFPMSLCRKCGSEDGLFKCQCGEVEQSVCEDCGCDGACESAVPPPMGRRRRRPGELASGATSVAKT